MNPEQKEQERLQRIIGLKRHEQPPPGYFQILPQRIMTRIERGDSKLGFWERVLPTFELQPVLAYAFAVASCAAMTASIFYSERVAGAGMPAVTQSVNGMSFAYSTTPDAEARNASARALQTPEWLGSTNPVTAMREDSSSVFGTLDARAIPVSYTFRN